jgi:hypothetical protein
MEENSTTKKIGGFHIFIIVIASLIFIGSLLKLISFGLGQDYYSYAFGEPTLIDWLVAVSGLLAAIILFVSEIKHMVNNSWYGLFLASMIIFILNNLLTLGQGIFEVVKGNSEYLSTLFISQDVFAILFWIFAAWFAKRNIN